MELRISLVGDMKKTSRAKASAQQPCTNLVVCCGKFLQNFKELALAVPFAAGALETFTPPASLSLASATDWWPEGG